jgi:hypothetical protein
LKAKKQEEKAYFFHGLGFISGIGRIGLRLYEIIEKADFK